MGVADGLERAGVRGDDIGGGVDQQQIARRRAVAELLLLFDLEGDERVGRILNRLGELLPDWLFRVAEIENRLRGVGVVVLDDFVVLIEVPTEPRLGVGLLRLDRAEVRRLRRFGDGGGGLFVGLLDVLGGALEACRGRSGGVAVGLRGGGQLG